LSMTIDPVKPALSYHDPAGFAHPAATC